MGPRSQQLSEGINIPNAGQVYSNECVYDRVHSRNYGVVSTYPFFFNDYENMYFTLSPPPNRKYSYV